MAGRRTPSRVSVRRRPTTPKMLKNTAQGNALGSHPTTDGALKGRKNIAAPLSSCALAGRHLIRGRYSQGVALGYILEPLRGNAASSSGGMRTSAYWLAASPVRALPTSPLQTRPVPTHPATGRVARTKARPVRAARRVRRRARGQGAERTSRPRRPAPRRHIAPTASSSPRAACAESTLRTARARSGRNGSGMSLLSPHRAYRCQTAWTLSDMPGESDRQDGQSRSSPASGLCGGMSGG
jgi:hypothetical protein